MLLKLVNYTIVGIALFYLAEGTHLIERGRYFPTLPRLDETASDPRAWLGAFTWGVGQAGQLATGGREIQLPPALSSTVRQLNLPSSNSYTQRLDTQRENQRRYMSAYYGS